MRIRDKIITAACLTPDGIEWTSLKVRQEGPEPHEQGQLPFVVSDEQEGGAAMATTDLPDEIREKLDGDITVSIRTAELLMRTMEFPTADPQEIASMVGFQIDKVSPFPLDQLAVAHEILRETEKGALVLMVASKREYIDSIGDMFKTRGIHIHSIDARILGWMELLRKGEHITGSGSELLIVDDGIDFTLTVLVDGVPIVFRSLQTSLQDENLADELANEIGYTLTTLDTEHELDLPASIEFWSMDDIPARAVAMLQEKTGIKIRKNNLASLPPLSEGILHRAGKKDSRIELIPREWIDHEKNKQLKKQFIVLSSAITGVWICVMIVFVAIYQTRAIALTRIQKKAKAIAPAAAQAFENRQKLKALENYSDRSNSALECLREVTRLLPAADIEFVSFNYSKDKGVTLRGTAESDNVVYDFFAALTKSHFFSKLNNQRIDTKVVARGVRRAVFSVNLVMPAGEDDQ